MDQRICKKCLLKQMDKEDYFKNVYEYIQSLPEDIKVPHEVYETRLGICMQCDHLINGMCKICGCFVETRAAKINNYCPCSEKKW